MGAYPLACKEGVPLCSLEMYPDNICISGQLPKA